MKTCPFCAESIQDEAIKCRHCGEMLETAVRPVTYIEPEKWEKVVVLRSDGSPRELLDAIATAVQAAKLPIVSRDYDNLTLRFESKGISWKSWSGDEVLVVVAPNDVGAHASFTAKGKPGGALRVQVSVNARTWVGRIIPGFGDLWRGPALGRYDGTHPPPPEDLSEGWKPDPTGRYPDRWYDGKLWTRYARDKPGGTRFDDPL